MKKLIFYSILLAMLASACTSSRKEGKQQVEVGETLSLNIPAYLEKDNELHDFAELQYSYDEGAFYLLGLQDSKADLRNKHLYYNLEDYTYYALDHASAKMDSAEIGEIQLDTLNGLRRMSVDIQGYIVQYDDSLRQADSLSIFYKVAVFETPTHYVQLFLWTHQDLYEQYAQDIQGIVSSLHSLDWEEGLAEKGVSGSSAECAEC